MTKKEEAIFDAKVESHFREQRELPNGRNFLWNVERFHNGEVQKNYDIGYCRTFPEAPGSRMCGACMHFNCELRGTGGF